MIHSLRKAATLILRIGVSVLSLGLVFYVSRGHFLEGVKYLKNVELFPFFIAVLVNFLSIVPVAVRLGMILKIQGVQISFLKNYYLWLISLFFNLFLPSAVGGDIAKGYYIYKESGKKMVAVTSIALDRFFGLVTAGSIGLVAFWLARDHIGDPRIGKIFTVFAVLMVIGVLFVMSRRFSNPARAFFVAVSPKAFKDQLEKIFDALLLYQNHKRHFITLYALSIAAQTCFVVLVYFLGLSIRIDLPIMLYFLFMPIVMVMSLVPSIGGLGVREATMVYLFGKFIDIHQAVALSILYDVFIYGSGALCGILYGVKGGASFKEVETLEEESLKKGNEVYES